MTAIRIHRLGIEGLAASQTTVGVNREALEAAVSEGTTQPVRLHRLGIEVMASSPPRPALQRQSAEAAVEQGQTQQINLHRLGIESLAHSLPRISLSRQALEAAIQGATAQPVRIHRLSVEIMGAVGLPPPVPLTLASNLEFFFHNWADELEIESSYTTDIVRSPETLAEERRSLQQRPDRVMTVKWLREGVDELFAIQRLLKNMTSTNVQVPLYPDVLLLDADALDTDDTVQVSLHYRRYHVGARVALFQVNNSYVPEGDVIVKTIKNLTASTLQFTTAIGTDVTAKKWAVVPLLDCEVMMEPEIEMHTDSVPELALTIREVHGANSLPPVALGLPDGWRAKNGLPIFEVETDWSNTNATGMRRYGSEVRIGRRLVPLLDGDRYSIVHNWRFPALERDEYWKLLSMFDSRRGRCLGMWVIDREAFHTVISTTTSSISVEPYGEFDEFKDLWTEANIAAAIVMNDGMLHVATVFSVTESGGLWHLTLDAGQAIAAGIDVTQIARFAPARISHFDSDAFKESWKSTHYCSTRLTTVEAQNELDIDIDTETP